MNKHQVTEEVTSFYKLPGNETGGKLHIVLDDGNIETPHVEWCIQKAKDAGDENAVRIGEMLLKLSYSQRLFVYRHHSRVAR